MAEAAHRTVLVLAEHDTTLHDTVALFERDGFTVQMASGEENVATWVESLKPSLIAYRLTDPSTTRSVCRRTLQAVAALPGPRTPSLALCELNEANAAAALCTEGLADDYLIVPHLKDDIDRLSTVTERLIALRQQRAVELRRTDAIAQLWQAFMDFDGEMQQELQFAGSDSRAAKLLASVRNAHHRARSRVGDAPVLVIDDDPDVQSLLKALVVALKQRVIAAADAGEAIQWLTNNEPALILLDYQMPGQDGLGLLERIRSMPQLASVPVIMLTGHSRADMVQRVRRLGVSDFIVKPSDAQTILRKIAAYL